MKNTKTQTLKGFRDFLPREMRIRNYIQNKIVETFELFGFNPLQTPTLEYAELLMGKYGDEADKLVYNFQDRGGRDVAMPYDQTVPTARVLSQYENQLPKIFKRYSIKNVFRADKPQKGRYREFTQCDIDIFGSNNPLADAEILATTYFSLKNIGFKNVKILLNSRQILMQTILKFTNRNDNPDETVYLFQVIQSIDKLDKVGKAGVIKELVNKGLKEDRALTILKAIQNSKQDENLDNIINTAIMLGIPKENIIFTPTLARGLDYYTSMIFEIQIPEYKVGSCGGGGRYDKLIGQLSGKPVPAVGVGLGFDRITQAAEQLNLIPDDINGVEVLVVNFDPNYLDKALQITSKLRKQGISTEIYIDNVKLNKQFKYAEEQGINYVVIVGEDEINQNKVTLKNIQTRDQEMLSIKSLIEKLSNIS